MAFDFNKGKAGKFDFSSGTAETPSTQPPTPTSNTVGAPTSFLGKVASGVGGFAKNVATGIGSTIIDTAHGIGSLVGLKPTDFGNRLLKSSDETAKGTVGKFVGQTAGNVAQFLAPGGLEEKAFLKAASVADKIPEVLGLGEKASSLVSGTLKVGAKAGITGASTGVVTAAQTGDLDKAKSAAIAGGIAGVFGQALESFGPGFGAALQKRGFKLTPATEAKAAQKVEAASEFMAKNKIFGTSATKFSKLENLTEGMENTIQASLPKKLQINKDAIGGYMNQALDVIRRENPAIYKAAKSDVQDAIGILKSHPGNTVTVEDVLNAKRSYGKQAFKQSKIYDAKVGPEGMYVAEQAYQKALMDTLESTNTKIKVPSDLQSYFGGKAEVSLSDFNKVYSDAISARNFTKIAQYRSDSSLTGRLFGTFLGESIGHATVPVVGGLIGRGVAEVLPGAIRNVSERALSGGSSFFPNATKTTLGLTRGPVKEKK